MDSPVLTSVLLPAGIALIMWSLGLPPELAVGLVLLGASPGGMMANMLTHLSRGDTALSVTMTAISSILSFAISKQARLDDRQATAIALELGIHNSALAIAVGASLAADVAIPAAAYATFMLFTGGAFAWAMSRRNIAQLSPEPADA